MPLDYLVSNLSFPPEYRLKGFFFLIFFLKKKTLSVGMDNLPAHISVHCVPIWWPWRPEKAIRSSRLVVTDICKLPCGGWDSNQCPLEEQPILLTVESHLQPLSGICVHSVLLSLFSNCAFISRSVHNRHPVNTSWRIECISVSEGSHRLTVQSRRALSFLQC